jgi:enoyl-CoA hydratase
LPAARAYQLGMVNKVCPESEVMDEGMKMADRICANAPLAVQASMGVAKRAFMDDDETLFKAGGRAFGGVAASEDFKEGPRAFIEKRAPNWQGR